MSGSIKRLKDKTKKISHEDSFEEHVSCAEKILINLENDDLSLEEAVKNYTEALNRIKLARKILENTCNKIEIIEGMGETVMPKKNTKIR